MTNPQSPICNSPASKRLEALVTKLRACTLCPKMHRPAVSGGAVVSRVMSVGQAPGVKEPVLGRPFAWTAGKTLYGWFTAACGWSEEDFRARIYMAAVCRCFPGKTKAGGDRVPDPGEIETCSRWLADEIEILRPALVLTQLFGVVLALSLELLLPVLDSVLVLTRRRRLVLVLESGCVLVL